MAKIDNDSENTAKNSPSNGPIARTPRGFADKRHHEILAEQKIVSAILETYQQWGFEQLETSAFEYADALGKFLPDQDRPNAGVFSMEDGQDQWISLRYDLTAPLARFVAENFQDLPKPFRRAAAGKVWRNEETGPGRYREFTQCDADTVGSARPEADAEVIAMQAEALVNAGVPAEMVQVQISSRKLLDGLLGQIGVAVDGDQKLIVMRAIDKLDRLGPNGVADLLGNGRLDPSGDFTKGAGLAKADIDKVLGFCGVMGNDRATTLSAISNLLGASAEAGLNELSAIDVALSALGLSSERARFNPAIVRGLEYYTGAVFEAEFLAETRDEKGNKMRFGAIGSGGRYDDLIMRFRPERVPATGCSIGVSRLMAALEAASKATGQKPISAHGPIIILALDADQMARYMALAARLRAAGFAAEVYQGGSGMKAQMKYADRRGARIAIIEGSNERENNTLMVKDLVAGALAAQNITDNETWRKTRPAQLEVPADQLIGHISAIFADSAEG